ncbi:MAG TPA: hypothetical protein VGF90_00665, partial [Verrucomicrobiae bacterium]
AINPTISDCPRKLKMIICPRYSCVRENRLGLKKGNQLMLVWKWFHVPMRVSSLTCYYGDKLRGDFFHELKPIAPFPGLSIAFCLGQECSAESGKRRALISSLNPAFYPRRRGNPCPARPGGQFWPGNDLFSLQMVTAMAATTFSDRKWSLLWPQRPSPTGNGHCYGRNDLLRLEMVTAVAATSFRRVGRAGAAQDYWQI